MGYTNYWRIKCGVKESTYKNALKDIRKIIKENSSILANGMGDSGSYPKIKGEISFNGIEDQSHETFHLPNTINKFDFRFGETCSFDFCKTAQKNYDKIVVACLCVLKYHLGHLIEISSDGDKDDLSDGIEIASKTLGVILLNQFKL